MVEERDVEGEASSKEVESDSEREEDASVGERGPGEVL